MHLRINGKFIIATSDNGQEMTIAVNSEPFSPASASNLLEAMECQDLIAHERSRAEIAAGKYKSLREIIAERKAQREASE